MFLGQISGVTSYLRLFGAGLLTSDSEGFSNTLMEYALAGVPAVAFDTGGNRASRPLGPIPFTNSPSSFALPSPSAVLA